MTSPPALLHNVIYHIYNRGVNRQNIFIEERNYAHFLNLYAKYIEPVADTYAYCLLRNHFHVLVRIKSEEEIQQTLRVSETLRVLSPSRQFSNFFNAYAKSINKAYNRTGSLFQHPFGRVPVTKSEQLYRVVMYIHQNPQKHKFVEDFREWKYSSYGTLLSVDQTRLQRAQVMDWFSDRVEFESLHADWIADSESAGFAIDDVE
jgi:putative transposase